MRRVRWWMYVGTAMLSALLCVASVAAIVVSDIHSIRLFSVRWFPHFWIAFDVDRGVLVTFLITYRGPLPDQIKLGNVPTIRVWIFAVVFAFASLFVHGVEASPAQNTNIQRARYTATISAPPPTDA